MMLVSSLKITRDQFSRTVHVNFYRQKRFRRSLLTWDIAILLDTTHRKYLSEESRLLTVCSDTLHPVCIKSTCLSLLIFVFRFL